MVERNECAFCGTEPAEGESGCTTFSAADGCAWFDHGSRERWQKSQNAAACYGEGRDTRARSEAGRKSPPKGVVGVRPIHMGEGKPGMVVVRIGDDNHGTNTALEANEAVQLAAELMTAAALTEVFQNVPDELADKIAAAQGEVRI